MRRRLFLTMLATAFAAWPATAQTIDWGPAGGDMFGRASVPPESFEDAVRLPALDSPFREALAAAAERHGLDAKLLQALVIVESGFRPDALSPAGAAGLTQLMPGTARDLGIEDRFDPAENLRGGADYLARQLQRFGDVKLALAAYNAGPARVARLGRVPSIPETEHYVAAVLDCFLALTAGRRVTSARQCREGSPVR